jgi:ATP-dependent DNA helicase RecG
LAKGDAPLELPVSYLRGIGAKKGEAFEKSGVKTLRDLIYYIPRNYIERSGATKIGDLISEPPGEVTLIGKITEARSIPMRGGRSRYEAVLDDGTGHIMLIWFRKTNQIKKWIKEGFEASFTGKINLFGHRFQMSHPEVNSLAKGEVQDIIKGEGRWVALYPGTNDLEKVGLDTRSLRNLMDRLLGEYLPSVEEIWPAEWRKKLKVLPIQEALAGVHRPKDAEEQRKGLRRLKMDELIMLQLLWAWTRRHNREKIKGIAYPEVGEMTRDLIKTRLPFELTDTQRRVLREIWNDMRKPHPMSRLLQGDVGSGKTVVALIAMTIAVENGFQAALMAPTEILAEQHYLTSKKFLEDLGVSVELLTGSSTAKVRKEKLARLANGQPGIIIGTHALIQDAVMLPNLGLSVIDEQHRFGVAQRLKMMNPKGGGTKRPDVLVMTATPIPRSLALSVYGDLEVSRLDEMPPGRGTVKTKAINGETDRENLYAKVRKAVEEGGRAYVIFPLVAESEKLDLQAAEEGRESLLEGAFKGLNVGLLHGRMKIDEKAAAMAKFASGETPILVSTTVVEVGVDVPEATEMVIEHSERFGMSQLHQLRGRIGRGGHDSRCYLVAYPPVSKIARARIKTMVSTSDGFIIAEEDLRIRGAGDIFGIRQHGMPVMKFADIVEDQKLLYTARKVAEELLEIDPDLSSVPGVAEEFSRSALKKATWLDVG